MTEPGNRISVPTPEVQHIPTIFRRLRSGEIRFPAFQRSFAWSESQILELLDSIHRGYPIGSMLLWKVESRLFRVARVSELPLPETADEYPVSFVLDGLQRLTSLYGVFHWQDRLKPNPFNVVYDLGNRQFRHFDPREKQERDLPLSALFSPKFLLEEHARLYKLANGEALVTETIDLQSVFQGYMVPTVTIANREVNEVVDIFARINSTGSALGPVDFMRALTWSNEFDLSVELEQLQLHLSEDGFDISEETLIKIVAVVSGRQPLSDEMLTLRSESPETLHALVKRAQRAINQSIAFLREYGLAQTSEFLPYEGQLIVLVKLFDSGGIKDKRVRNEILGWYWGTSFNEELRGKPDHFVARMMKRVMDVAADPASSLNSNLALSLDDVVFRRLIKGKALSSAVLLMLGARSARSVLTGEVISKPMYLDAFNPEAVQPIFSMDQLDENLNRKVPSSRLLANILVTSPDEALQLRKIGVLEALRTLSKDRSKYTATLDSQCLSERFVAHLSKGEVVDALFERGAAMLIAAKELVE